MGVLEEIVSKDVKKFAKRGYDMRLVNGCFRIAASDDQMYYASIGVPAYAKQIVREKADIYRLSVTVLRILVDDAARGLHPEEEGLANAYEAAVSSHKWLSTLRKEGSLLRMPGYCSDYVNMTVEYRRARLMAEVNSLLGRRTVSSGK